MKKIYSNILLTSLLVLTGFKNFFIKKAIAFDNVIPNRTMGDFVAVPPQSPIEKTISGIKLVMVSPILVISIILFVIYVILKIKKKDIKNINLFLISGTLGIALYSISVITVMTLQEDINNLSYDNQNIFSLIVSDKYKLVLALSNTLLFVLFLYFLIKTIIVNLRKRKDLTINNNESR